MHSHEADACSCSCPGDELILILERVEVTGAMDGHEIDKWAYMLPNFRAGGAGDAHSVKMVFPFHEPPVHLRENDKPYSNSYHVWQLVPSIASMSNISCWERKGFWRLGTVH